MTAACTHETPHPAAPAAHEGEHAFRVWLRRNHWRRFCAGDHPRWLVAVWAVRELW